MSNVYTAFTVDSSDCEGALSRSSNDIVDSEDVDSVSLGILPELWCELLQESDVTILVLVASTYHERTLPSSC